MKIPLIRTIPLILLAPAACLASAVERTVLNETFTGVQRMQADLPVSAAWFSATEAEHLTHNPAVGTLTLESAPASSRHVLAYFTEPGGGPLALEVGESMELDYSVIFTNPVHTETISNSFRVGLFNSRLDQLDGARIDADGMGGVSPDNSPSHFDTYTGYRFDTILHANSSQVPLRVLRRKGESPGAALITITTDYTGTLAGGGEPVNFPTGLYHGEVRVYRDGPDQVRFSHRIRAARQSDNIDMAIQGAATGGNALFAFDTIAFGINSRVAESFTLYQVTITVKEVEAAEVQVGSRTVRTTKFNKKGTPVVPMWQAPMPSSNQRDGAGLPVLDNAEHAYVWQPPTRDDGAYNHYAALIHYKGRFFAMWGNHPLGEDAPGQRVLFAYSDEWGQWTDATELYPAPGPVKPRSESGIHLKPDRWMIIDDKLYAVTFVFGAGSIYPIAREVSLEGEMGDPFLVRALPPGSGLPGFMQDLEDPTAVPLLLSAKIRLWYTQNNQVSWWARHGEGVPATGIDGAALIETFSYRAVDGTRVLFARDWGTNSNPVHSNRLYVSFNDGVSGWGTPYPTDIPDSPSRAEALTMDDGTVLLIGNQIAPVFDQPLYLDRDPLTVSISRDGYTFDRVYALRANGPEGYRFSNVSGRNRGFAYISSIVHDGWLYSFYSIRKEDMGITRVRLSELELTPYGSSRSLFEDVMHVGGGWVHSESFGYLMDAFYPFVYFAGCGWKFISGASEAGFLAWDKVLGWFYTGAGIYPHVFVYADQAWRLDCGEVAI
jgi:hypothetical protein